MKTDHLLNTLILSLSVATILITLISYLIFKVRQFSIKKNIPSGPKKEGVFFRRHVSQEAITNNAEEPLTRKFDFLSKNKLITYFGMILVIVFASLYSRDYFVQKFARYDRAKTAKSIQELQKLGLYQSREINKFNSENLLEEKILPSQTHLHEQKLSLLRSKRIALVDLKQKSQRTALIQWRKYFENTGIKISHVENLKNLDFDVYVLPQIKSLSNSQIIDVEKLFLAKKNFVVTGPTGVLDGLGDVRPVPWLTSALGIEVKHIGLDHLVKPSNFRDVGPLGLTVPPGLKINWGPIVDEYRYLTNPDSTFSYESEFNGKNTKMAGKISGRGSYIDKNTSKIIWLNLDPIPEDSLPKGDLFYARSAVTDLLFWTSGFNTIKLADWKEGNDWAMVLSSDCEEKIEGSYEIWRKLKDYDLPATLFIVTDLLKMDDRLTELKSQHLEIGSHTETHKVLTELDLEQQFDELQNSRLDLEKRTKKPVKGFHPPLEKFNEKTLAAASQNHYSYFVGDQRLFRMAPLRLTNDMTYFPRVFSDDFVVVKNKNLFSDQDIVNFLTDDVKTASLMGGLYYLNLHSQVMGQPAYGDTLELLFSELSGMKKVWKTTFLGLDHWSRQRSAMEVKIREKEVIIKNPLLETVNGLVLKVDGRAIPVGEIKAGESKVVGTP